MKVTLPYDPVWLPLQWAKDNCPSYITNDCHLSSDGRWLDKSKIDYFFGDEQDALLFILRWA